MAATNTARSLLTATAETRRRVERRPAPSDLQSFFSDPRSFPFEFFFERVVAQHDSLYVLGRERTWKFSREEFAGARRRPFLRRLEEAADELALAEILTPGMYEGVRIFSVAQGVPIPLHDEPIGEIGGFHQSLRGAETLCCSLHRVYHARTLTAVCRDDAGLAHSFVPRLARRLRSLHSSALYARRRSSVRWTSHASRSEMRQLFARLATQGCRSPLIQELERFCFGALAALGDRFRSRALSGLATLPALTSPKNTVVGRFYGGTDSLFVFPDLLGLRSPSVGDPLREVARFIVAIDMAGRAAETSRLVSIYAKGNELFDPDVLRLSVVLEALERAVDGRSDARQSLVECASRYAFGTPFVGEERPQAVFVHPADECAGSFIAEQLAARLGSTALPRTADLCALELDLRHCPAGIREIEAGSRILALLERALSAGQSVVCEDLPLNAYSKALEVCARLNAKVVSVGDERSTRFARSAPLVFRRGVPAEQLTAGMTSSPSVEEFISDTLRLCGTSRIASWPG